MVNTSSYTAVGGSKYIYHPEKIAELLRGGGRTPVSTTIAPTNRCNLHCSYCNQDVRQRSQFLSLDYIKNFINALKERDLKSVVISGGGEPTTYPQFNDLVKWLKDETNLSLGLITNGTNNLCGKERVNTWDAFDWIRVSLNFINDKLLRIKVPNNKDGKLGMSMVFTNQSSKMIEEIAKLAEEYRARFVRIIMDCNKHKAQTGQDIDMLREIIEKLDNKDMFFLQKREYYPATRNTCNVSKLKSFMCADGSVAPCDCWMQNTDKNGKMFSGTLPDRFNLAKGGIKNYLEYLDGVRKPNFNPAIDCNSCGYTQNNDLLEEIFILHEKYPQDSVLQLFERLGIKPADNIKDINFV